MNKYYNPVKVINTNDWVKELKKNIKFFNFFNPIIITSEGNKKRLEIENYFKDYLVYSEVSSNPTFDDCNKILEFSQKNSFDSVIAIGGGSVMDIAKVVMAYLSLSNSNLKELISYEKSYKNKISSIFIPTTHGTASEVTKWGTLWNMEEKKKYSISNPELYPSIAILDPRVTLSLPLDLSIITIMDALSHSLESIWNKNSNPKSTDYAIKAISIIINNYKEFKKNPKSLRLRKLFLNASNTAGLAFSNTQTAAAHSISYPLTLLYGIPHGIASSITLIPLLKINKNYIKKELKTLCSLNRISLEDFLFKIEDIPRSVVSMKLKDWGIKKSCIKKLSDYSFTKGRMDNNIAKLNKNDVENIF